MSKWYFTFGFGQEHANHYVVIEAKSSDLARKRMFDLFEDKWCWQYDEDSWLVDSGEDPWEKVMVTQAEKYHYKELAIL